MTDPQPLTDETSEATMTAALRRFGWTCGPEFWERYYQDAWVFNLANAVERLTTTVEQVRKERDDLREALDVTLVAAVEQVRRERDAAHAVIRQLTDSWDPEELAEPDDDFWSPAEVDAIRRAQAATAAESGGPE